MKLLVTGISGRVGFEIANFFLARDYEISGTFLDQKVKISNAELYKLDVSRKSDTVSLIKKIKPDIIVHSAALTNADLCETDNELANKINVKGTENIVNSAASCGAKVVLISTSNVFDGKKPKYIESEKTNAINYYGHTKILAENILKNSTNDYLIVRTDHPYNWVQPWQKDNSVTRIIKKLEAKEKCEDIVDWYNTPTFMPDLAEAVYELVSRDKNGIYHAVGPDYVNRYEWSLSIAKIFNKDATLIKPIEAKTLKLDAKRSNANLSNSKIKEELGMEFKGVKEGLKAMYKERYGPSE